MSRVAVIGGGIAGLAAAFELELARNRGAAVDWQLYEATDRLGGIVETTRLQTSEGDWILEGGPDGWVSEKPWARELAVELGLESELIASNDATRKTYIYLDGRLQAMPDRMRMMVPEDLATLETSPLFSTQAKQDYADELTRADELKASSPFANETYDESVATFVRRHFGEEVLAKVAGPLLSGVFGGNVEKLSVRAVMAPFVRMEQEHGSLIAAVQQRARERGDKPAQPIFTSLRRGVGSLVEALVATLPVERLHRKTVVHELGFEDAEEWVVWSAGLGPFRKPSFPALDSLSAPPTLRTQPSGSFDAVLVATSLDETRRLLFGLDLVETTLLPSSASAYALLPQNASSAVLVTFCWPAHVAETITVPPGFGFLVASAAQAGAPQLLAATFVDQKFPHRCPDDARIIRAFFGSGSAEGFADSSDVEVAEAALAQLRSIMGPLPEPEAALTSVRRWPRSLPQYEVGHLHRMSELDELVARFEGSIGVLGNSYRGVGLPDLIRDARKAARKIIEPNILSS